MKQITIFAGDGKEDTYIRNNQNDLLQKYLDMARSPNAYMPTLLQRGTFLEETQIALVLKNILGK